MNVHVINQMSAYLDKKRPYSDFTKFWWKIRCNYGSISANSSYSPTKMSPKPLIWWFTSNFYARKIIISFQTQMNGHVINQMSAYLDKKQSYSHFPKFWLQMHCNCSSITTNSSYIPTEITPNPLNLVILKHYFVRLMMQCNVFLRLDIVDIFMIHRNAFLRLDVVDIFKQLLKIHDNVHMVNYTYLLLGS